MNANANANANAKRRAPIDLHSRRDYNGPCPECARSNGPHYSGPCEHGSEVTP